MDRDSFTRIRNAVSSTYVGEKVCSFQVFRFSGLTNYAFPWCIQWLINLLQVASQQIFDCTRRRVVGLHHCSHNEKRGAICYVSPSCRRRGKIMKDDLDKLTSSLRYWCWDCGRRFLLPNKASQYISRSSWICTSTAGQHNPSTPHGKPSTPTWASPYPASKLPAW